MVITRGGRRIASIGPVTTSNGAEVLALLASHPPDDDPVIAAITVAELRTGVELATKRHRAARTAFLVRVLETMPVEPYDVSTAEVHGRPLAHVHRVGTPRGANDLLIAATAIATKRTILTRDRNAQFDDLPGVDCLMVD